MIRILSRLAATARALPRSVKQRMVLTLDAALCVLSVGMAFYMRTGECVSLVGPVIFAIGASVVIALPVFITSGLYRAIFRYSGFPAMVAVARAMLLYSIAYATIFAFWGVEGVPEPWA